ncbi:hypothetical protein H0E87_011847 [Populus deltoides]|uniref:NFACT RNA-binding domain-containing protein n=1 Tax=Populus deltoides TaxID=3696 RepID=A0A8T2YH35_POPDE|nr:hypothetical protein H0E87_011847 [Populus deltoides]
MVFYFKARPEAGDYTIFMGLDKHENEELIKYGFPEDIWFHVDKMSSAHVYLRLHKGQTIDGISEGNKVNNIDVVYTPWANLKKTASMDVGQVGFHNSKMVRTVRVEKRINEIVNRLNKTKVERKPDLKAEREAVNAAERAERKLHLRDKVSSIKSHVANFKSLSQVVWSCKIELYLMKIYLFGISSGFFHSNLEDRIVFFLLGLLLPFHIILLFLLDMI